MKTTVADQATQLAALRARLETLREIYGTVSRDFSTRDNIDLEHLLRVKISETERRVRGFLGR